MSENAPASGIACIHDAFAPAFDQQNGALAVIRITILIAIAKTGSDFSRIARADGRSAHYTAALRGGPTSHQDEPHVAAPNAKQYTMSNELKRVGGGAQM